MSSSPSFVIFKCLNLCSRFMQADFFPQKFPTDFVAKKIYGAKKVSLQGVMSKGFTFD